MARGKSLKELALKLPKGKYEHIKGLKGKGFDRGIFLGRRAIALNTQDYPKEVEEAIFDFLEVALNAIPQVAIRLTGKAETPVSKSKNLVSEHPDSEDNGVKRPKPTPLEHTSSQALRKVLKTKYTGRTIRLSEVVKEFHGRKRFRRTLHVALNTMKYWGEAEHIGSQRSGLCLIRNQSEATTHDDEARAQLQTLVSLFPPHANGQEITTRWLYRAKTAGLLNYEEYNKIQSCIPRARGKTAQAALQELGVKVNET